MAEWWVQSRAGWLQFGHSTDYMDTEFVPEEVLQQHGPGTSIYLDRDGPPFYQIDPLIGPICQTKSSEKRYSGYSLLVPHWLAVSVLALPAALGVVRLRRSMCRRNAAGCCQACGYDLRATPERCPECGKAVA